VERDLSLQGMHVARLQGRLGVAGAAADSNVHDGGAPPSPPRDRGRGRARSHSVDAPVDDGASAGGGGGRRDVDAVTIELQCARRDMDALSKEVRAIAACLDVGAVQLGDFDIRMSSSGGGGGGGGGAGGGGGEAGAAGGSGASSCTVPPAIATASIRSHMRVLQERVAEVDAALAGLRSDTTRLRAGVAAATDDCRKNTALVRDFNAVCTALVDRVAELEACLLLIAPEALASARFASPAPHPTVRTRVAAASPPPPPAVSHTLGTSPTAPWEALRRRQADAATSSGGAPAAARWRSTGPVS